MTSVDPYLYSLSLSLSLSFCGVGPLLSPRGGTGRTRALLSAWERGVPACARAGPYHCSVSPVSLCTLSQRSSSIARSPPILSFFFSLSSLPLTALCHHEIMHACIHTYIHTVNTVIYPIRFFLSIDIH